jgi:CheY-like chemotaxis protein
LEEFRDSSPHSQNSQNSKKLIFIVEDDQFILESLVELLTEEGYQVLAARNGQEAIDSLRGLKDLPNLILLDLMMPIKDGVAFRKEQAEDPRLSSIPIVLMSADGQLEAKRISMNLQHHIKKPVDIDTVLDTVKRFAL